MAVGFAIARPRIARHGVSNVRHPDMLDCGLLDFGDFLLGRWVSLALSDFGVEILGRGLKIGIGGSVGTL